MDFTAVAARLATLPYLNGLPKLFELYRHFRHAWNGHYHEGLYEILEYEARLELRDAKGESAFFQKRQRVKFLQENVIAFEDFAWGDGDVLVDYRVSPGIDVDRYQEGQRWNVLISLRETKSAGDIEEFYIERKIRRGFTKTEEWWQIVLQHPTRQLRFAVIFPSRRRCQSAVLIEQNRDRTTPLGSEHLMELPDGRQKLIWESENPNRFETYTLKWKW